MSVSGFSQVGGLEKGIGYSRRCHSRRCDDSGPHTAIQPVAMHFHDCHFNIEPFQYGDEICLNLSVCISPLYFHCKEVLPRMFVLDSDADLLPWQLPNGQHHNQIDFILVTKRLQSGVSERGQNTKFSRSRHWKWSWIADDDLPPSPEKNQPSQTHKTEVWPRKAERSQCVGKFPSCDRQEVCTSHHHEQ